ncbi:MAG TPA: 2OG-Fe(II) oxygenase [Cellvibrionaceae bacterium]
MNLFGLFTEGWAVIPSAFTNVEPLVKIAERLSGSFRAAHIGRDNSARLEQNVRSDKIMWLDENVDPAVNVYLNQMEAIRELVNQRCFLGLFDYECHFANFEPGDFYKTHVDAFADERNPRGNRKLSSVFYLNKDWQPEDGGELVLYAPDSREEIARVLPQLGTLVLFLSEEFPHEVLPARRLRQSLTGWFRTRPQGI